MFTIGSAAENYQRNMARQESNAGSGHATNNSRMIKVLELRYAILRNPRLSLEEDVEFQDFVRMQSVKLMPASRPVSAITTTSTQGSTSTGKTTPVLKNSDTKSRTASVKHFLRVITCRCH